MGARLHRWLAAAGAVAIVTGCGGGGDDVSDIVIDPRPTPATTVRAPLTVPVTSEPPGAPGSTAGPAAATNPTLTGEWVPVTGNLTGMSSECGNVGLASVPAADLLVAGVALRGLWSIAPGTTEWTPLGVGGDPITNRILSLVVDPADPATYWESGPYGAGGVYRTDDHGATFVRQGDVTHTDHVSVDFTDPERRTLLAGSHESPVLYRSTDGGDTWDEVPGLPGDHGFATSPHVIDAQTFLLGTSNGDAAGVFRSVDGGESWTQVFEGGVVGAPVVQADGTLHWLAQDGAGLVTSADDGVTWTERPGNGAIARTAGDLIGMPDGSLVTFSDTSIVQSADGGATWQRVGPALPYTPNDVAYAAGEATFYVSRFDCSFTDDNPIKPDAILRLVSG